MEETISKKRLLFIVNPISGFGWGKEIAGKIKAIPEYSEVEYKVVFTEYAGHATELVEQVRRDKTYTHIIAAGGDGTVNEIGVALLGSTIVMGIIPLGSGNGFARHLGYSSFMFRSLRQVLTDQSEAVDVIKMNDKYGLNVNGVGFDAEVAHAFNKGKFRGPLPYAYNIIRLYFKYHEKRYKITSEGEVMKVSCFILSFANSSQYGNNAFIAPHASLTDGLLDICILRRPDILDILSFLFFIINKRIYKLSLFKELQCSEAIVEGDIKKVHIDGDAYEMNSPIRLKVVPKALNVIIPKPLEH